MSQVLRKTQVPPSGPQSCRQGVQEGLILREAASCCKLESRILICSTGAAPCSTRAARESWSLGFHLQHVCCIRNRTLQLAARVLHQKSDTPTFCSTRAASEIGHSNSEIGHSNFLQLGSNFFAAHMLHQNIQDSNMAMIYLADGAPLTKSNWVTLRAGL